MNQLFGIKKHLHFLKSEDCCNSEDWCRFTGLTSTHRDRQEEKQAVGSAAFRLCNKLVKGFK